MSPRIENSERGITLNKTLAWTIAIGIATGSLWLGASMAELNSEMRNVVKQADVAALRRAELETRIRALESSAVDQGRWISSISSNLEEIKAAQNEILKELRGR